MKIIEIRRQDMSEFEKSTSCKVYRARVIVKDVAGRASEMIRIITDMSWIDRLDAVDKTSYQARAQKTIDKLVNNIFRVVEDAVTDEFGEYMISDVAQCALEQIKHRKFPLAEIWKEKVTGNPGFDFHTENTGRFVVFGEAKYSAKYNPYAKAVDQIVRFIGQRKDDAELADLRRFASNEAINNAMEGRKAFVAAFSINAKKPDKIIDNCLSSNEIDPLLEYPELYVIGVEVERSC